MFEQTEWYIFILAALTVAAVYYVGVKTDIKAFSDAINSILNVATGRGPEGGKFYAVSQ